MSKPFICLQTDFGIHWGTVSCMHGVIAAIDPELRVNDICHQLPPFKPWYASYCLKYTAPNWPAGTVFVSVVDPGVGTARRASVAKTGLGHYIVTPDNGTLTHIKAFHGIEAVRQIDEKVNRRPGSEKVETFHGRDIFAWTAGRLASGLISFEGVGPAYPVEEIITFPLEKALVQNGLVEGMVDTASDHFGSVNSNVTIEDFERAGFRLGDRVALRITHKGKTVFDEKVLYHQSFGFVGIGEPVLYNGSSGFIILALNQENFVKKYAVGEGSDWRVSYAKDA
jgi:S-adenosylmethionine hydrolase